MKNRADWLSWSLQFVFGFIAGGFFSIMFIRSGRRSLPLIARETSPVFMLGAALIGAALASYHGDQLWLGSSYRVIPPDEPRHSDTSRRASLVVGCIGVLLVVVAIIRTLGIVL